MNGLDYDEWNPATDANLAAPTYYGDTSLIAGGDELPMNFNFPLASAILTAVREGYAGPIQMVLAEMDTAYPNGVLDGTFLTNHDMPRVATQLGNDPTGLDLAASILLTLPGTPFLYYGEEIGMTGTKPDPDIRTPMQWRDAPGAGFTDGEPWRPPISRESTSRRRAAIRGRCCRITGR